MKLDKIITNAMVAITCFAPLIITPFAYDHFYYPKILFIYVVLAYIGNHTLLSRKKTKPLRMTDTSDKTIG
ncbi:MAG: hypothetical protein ACOX27_04370, partial [Caldicoprobacterales bacterium]